MVLITSYNYSYWGESKPTYNWGASHCMIEHEKKCGGFKHVLSNMISTHDFEAWLP